jgi:hypothetical protein
MRRNNTLACTDHDAVVSTGRECASGTDIDRESDIVAMRPHHRRIPRRQTGTRILVCPLNYPQRAYRVLMTRSLRSCFDVLILIVDPLVLPSDSDALPNSSVALLVKRFPAIGCIQAA